MKISSLIYAALLTACPFVHASAQQDSIAIEDTKTLGNKFTVKVNNLKLKNADGQIIIRVAQDFGGTCFGVRLGIKADSLFSYGSKDTVLVATRLTDGLEAHNYAFTTDGSLVMKIYRDNVLFGAVTESLVTTYPGAAIFSAEHAEEEFTSEVNAGEAETITDHEGETNLYGMLPTTLTNLIEDPFFNRGFTYSGVNSADREGIYTQQAIYSGWGSGAYIDSEAFSGQACARIEGQAVHPSQGASLDVTLSLKANTPYLVRAMVKSDGYEGKIGIDKCSNYIYISDTNKEWKQVEAVLTPTEASTLLFINNSDFDSNGTLWIDNLEVYQGYASTSAARRRTEIPYVMVDVGTNFATTGTSNVYMLGLTDNGTQCATVDTSKVKAVGGMMLKKKYKGSALYAIHFPGELIQATATGWYDGFSHTDEQLRHGLDFAVVRYEAPRFHYLRSDEPLTAGNYLIQFVDNLEDMDVTLTFNGQKEGTPATGTYRMEGNPYATTHTPEGKFLKYDNDAQRFILTEGESLKPFEAYIATDETNPVGQIIPSISATCISKTLSDEGSAISVRNVSGGMVIYATEAGRISIYGIDGRIIRTADLHEGDNHVSMPRGIYIVGRKKVAIH